MGIAAALVAARMGGLDGATAAMGLSVSTGVDSGAERAIAVGADGVSDTTSTVHTAEAAAGLRGAAEDFSAGLARLGAIGGAGALGSSAILSPEEPPIPSSEIPENMEQSGQVHEDERVQVLDMLFEFRV